MSLYDLEIGLRPRRFIRVAKEERNLVPALKAALVIPPVLKDDDDWTPDFLWDSMNYVEVEEQILAHARDHQQLGSATWESLGPISSSCHLGLAEGLFGYDVIYRSSELEELPIWYIERTGRLDLEAAIARNGMNWLFPPWSSPPTSLVVDSSLFTEEIVREGIISLVHASGWEDFRSQVWRELQGYTHYESCVEALNDLKNGLTRRLGRGGSRPEMTPEEEKFLIDWYMHLVCGSEEPEQ